MRHKFMLNTEDMLGKNADDVWSMLLELERTPKISKLTEMLS
jgi:hypothetical protein